MGSFNFSRSLSAMVLMLLVIMLGAKPSFATKAELVAALDNLPEKAPFAVVIPNVKAFSDKVANLAKALGVPSGEMNNLLATIKDETGLASGLREDGALILTLADTTWFEKQAEALKNKQQASHNEPPKMIGLVPVTDADAFMNNLTNLRTEEGLTVGTDKDGEDHYMKAMGKFVVMSDDKAAVQSFTAAKQGAMWLKDAGDISQKTLDQADIVMLADMRKLSPSLLPMIEEGMKQFGQMQKDMAAQPGMTAGPADMAMLQTIMSMYAQTGTTLVRDTQVVMVAGNLSDKGLGLSMGAQLKPDSFLGKALKNGSPAAGLLSKVVNQNYLAAGALNAQGIDLKALLGEVQKQLEAVSKDTQGGQMEWVVTLIKDMIPVYQNMRGMAQVMYIPAQVQMGMPMFNVVTLVDSADAPGFVEGMKKIMASMSNIKMPMADASVNDPAAGITYTTSYTAGAMQIEGVSVDQFTWQMQMPPELMQNNPAMPFMMMMGATGQTGYIAQVGDHVVSTSTTDAQLLGATIKMLKAGNGLGTDKLIVDARSSALPEKPMMESYLSLGGVVSLANMFIPMSVPPIQVPADLPPVAMGVSLQDSAMVGTMHVPMPVMTFVRDTVQQLQAGPQQQQQQGGGSAPRRRQNPNNAPAF